MTDVKTTTTAETEVITPMTEWVDSAGMFAATLRSVLETHRSIVPELNPDNPEEPYERREAILTKEQRLEVQELLLSTLREMHKAIISETLTPKL